MKLLKINRDLNESIEHLGESYNPIEKPLYKEVETDFTSVAPVSYAEAVKQVAEWREEANEALKERYKKALETAKAEDKDRFSHMTNKEKELNESLISLNEDLEVEEEVKVESPADDLLASLALIDFKDWKNLAINLLDNLDEDQVDEFIKNYEYDSEVLSDDEINVLKEGINPTIVKYRSDGYIMPPEVFDTLSDKDQKQWFELKKAYDVKHPRKPRLQVVGHIDPKTKKTLLSREELDDWEY